MDTSPLPAEMPKFLVPISVWTKVARTMPLCSSFNSSFIYKMISAIATAGFFPFCGWLAWEVFPSNKMVNPTDAG